MRRFTSKSTGQLEDEVAQLTALVEEMKGRLERLEGGTSDAENGDGNARSRRDLLKLAGAAAVGAAGAVVLGSVPAAAATSTPMLNGVTNDTGTSTNVVPTGGSSPSPIFQALGQGVTAPIVPVNSLNQSIPLIGAIGPGGSLPPIGTPPVNDYPGYAPIQGVGGVTIITRAGVDQTVSEGINGWGKGNTGIGITGESDVGYGVVGGSGGIDLAALGNGRVLQLPLPSGPTNSLLSSPPSGPPPDALPVPSTGRPDATATAAAGAAVSTARSCSSWAVDTAVSASRSWPSRMFSATVPDSTRGSWAT